MEQFDQREKELWTKVSTGEGEEKARALMELGHDAFHKGNHVDALAMCETALQVYESMGTLASTVEIGNVYQRIGWSLRALERFEEAAQAAHRAAKLYKEYGIPELFRALNEEGDYWYAAENWEKSLEIYLQALTEVNPDRSDIDLAYTHGNCGFAFARLKDWQASATHFIAAREYFRKIKNPVQVAFCDEEISMAYFKLGNGLEALIYAQKALDFAESAQAIYRLIYANGRMGLAKKLLGEYETALDHFETSLGYLRSEREPYWPALIGIQHHIADIYELQGLFQDATEIRRRLIVLEETIGANSDEE
jgi:tetratricopeptide (TPR) repeat protein